MYIACVAYPFAFVAHKAHNHLSIRVIKNSFLIRYTYKKENSQNAIIITTPEVTDRWKFHYIYSES